VEWYGQGKSVVVPLGPPQSYMDIPKRPVSCFSNRTSTSKVVGVGGGVWTLWKRQWQTSLLRWIRLSRTEGVQSYKWRRSPSYEHKCEKVKKKWQQDTRARSCLSRPICKRKVERGYLYLLPRHNVTCWPGHAPRHAANCRNNVNQIGRLSDVNCKIFCGPPVHIARLAASVLLVTQKRTAAK
jgi:hypothetical protein